MNQKTVYMQDEGAVEKIKELINDNEHEILVVDGKQEEKQLYVIGFGGDISMNTRALLEALEKHMYYPPADENATKKKMNGGRFYPDNGYYHKFNKFKPR